MNQSKKSNSFRLIIFSLLIFLLFFTSAKAQMKMHVINVGQAESILLEFPHQAILVDAGSYDSSDESHLFQYLDDFFNRRTDLNNTFYSVIISHPHKDHTKSLKRVFDRYKVIHFIEGGETEKSSGLSDLQKVRKVLEEKNIIYHKIAAEEVKQQSFMKDWRDRLLTDSQVEVKFLSGSRKCNNPNNASLVMRIAYKGKSFLLLGDAEENDIKKNAQGKIISEGCGGLLYRLLDSKAAFPELLDVDVYKVGHHGSRNGTVIQLLNKTTPAYAVISAGDNTKNQTAGSFSAWDHGHPNEEKVQMLESKVENQRTQKVVTTMMREESKVIKHLMKKGVYCTGWDGDIVFTVTATGNLDTPTTLK